ncbi:hypothetical protein GTO89_00810 [Heliobacterium gestii]|uniref:Uncharacterized protein n=1 Tax=Heliomicrobium gestii TaxID=2699 RepID=A0A845L7K8_HELGE|nr:hypothetical protein [Heliomicrobium gestii]MBM7865310.1 rRNA maturation protein Nop10 [Heliomicrobium gestii]MZP41571.1 hypothetical protein [Heliomicrobium gestii]
MESVCPACNGIARISIPCRRCSALMEDRGRLEDYAQPYSPYDIDDELGEASRAGQYDVASPSMLQGASANESGRRALDTCAHLFVCPQCGSDRRLSIPRRFI